MAKKKSDYDFSSETVKRKRTFPTGKVIILSILIILQLLCVFGIVFYRPSPQDIIDKYEVYVTPKPDGSLDVEYKFKWTPLDEDEPLTYVYVGVPNSHYRVISYSDNISKVKKRFYDNGERYVNIYFDREYNGGETLDFSFTVNQGSMLCERDGEYFYEFVPSWFNSIPVKEYAFYWRADECIISNNADYTKDGWHIWQGSMNAGEYRMMRVVSEKLDASTVSYEPFYDGGVENELENDRFLFIFIMSLIIALLFVFEVYCFDTVVSYHRGRGFITGYGHPMYVYGRTNRNYVRALERHSSTHGGHIGSGFGSGGLGGCACACACACAGGGRAGCSQKDTVRLNNKTINLSQGDSYVKA